MEDDELFGERHEQEEYGLYGRKHAELCDLHNVRQQSELLKPLPPRECSQCGVLIDHRLNECGDCRL